MGNWLRRVMAGRYGVDQFTWVLLGVAVLFTLCSGIFHLSVFSILSWAVLIYAYIRIFSRNIPARQRENQALMRFWYKLKNGRSRSVKQAADHKTYRYYSCPNCMQKLRVPRGKGKISITCPKCNTSFVKKT